MNRAIVLLAFVAALGCRSTHTDNRGYTSGTMAPSAPPASTTTSPAAPAPAARPAPSSAPTAPAVNEPQMASSSPDAVSSVAPHHRTKRKDR